MVDQETEDQQPPSSPVADYVVPSGELGAVGVQRADYSSVFGYHPAGVAVITARGPEGPVGLTVSSVSSVSADPPIIGFSLQARSGSAALVAQADSLLVHLLDAPNIGLARAFATHGAPRFGDAMDWKWLPTGEPLLKGVGRVLRVHPLARIQAGPALVFDAGVVQILGTEPNGAPMVYHKRQFHSLSAESVVDYEI
ncbi:flavin reductase family protein [Kocuria coralli]|uniref:Flavin reductase family protein n=1 Tax=Kocuria coralli TaxID=1461025 RepID=A0A5J5KT24_9MICC|nr:flavin reductase family protein [Kocuria coralli]KAA9392917.1 flavin reductase family protein [Kocuria coralli]